MTIGLEQKFFKVFGIKPTIIDACKITDEYWNNEELADKYGCFALYMREKCPYDEDCRDNCEYAFDKIKYPEITDRKLLEMITSLANALCNYFIPCVDYYNLKSRVLYDCIQNKENEELQYNIQQLFKEEE